MEIKIHPKDYAIAIRYDGVAFRVDKDSQEEKFYSFQYGDRPCAFRSEYFDHLGHLRKEFWNLPILKNSNFMKRAEISTKNTVEAYGNETNSDVGLKAAIIVVMYDIFATLATVKSIMHWVRESKAWYGKYFVILVDDTLTVRDKKNIDKIILNIDLSEMEA